MTALLVDGKVCTRCGVEKPMEDFSANKLGRGGLHARCRSCTNEARREYRARHPERHRELDRAWYAANKAKFRAYNLNKLYGITIEQYEAMVEAQAGVCALCSKPPTGRANGGRLHVDHDHKTGIVRRLLCHHCNRGLGCFYDDPEALRRAAAYIEAFR